MPKDRLVICAVCVDLPAGCLLELYAAKSSELHTSAPALCVWQCSHLPWLVLLHLASCRLVLLVSFLQLPSAREPTHDRRQIG